MPTSSPYVCCCPSSPPHWPPVAAWTHFPNKPLVPPLTPGSASGETQPKTGISSYSANAGWPASVSSTGGGYIYSDQTVAGIVCSLEKPLLQRTGEGRKPIEVMFPSMLTRVFEFLCCESVMEKKKTHLIAWCCVTLVLLQALSGSPLPATWAWTRGPRALGGRLTLLSCPRPSDLTTIQLT